MKWLFGYQFLAVRQKEEASADCAAGHAGVPSGTYGRGTCD
jgi:hypothetical protein